jgi:hypothetical protein
MHPSQSLVLNNFQNNNGTSNNVYTFSQQNTQLNNFARNLNSFGLNPNNFALNTNNMLITQQAISAMNNAYNNCSNLNNFKMINNFSRSAIMSTQVILKINWAQIRE